MSNSKLNRTHSLERVGYYNNVIVVDLCQTVYFLKLNDLKNCELLLIYMLWPDCKFWSVLKHAS